MKQIKYLSQDYGCKHTLVVLKYTAIESIQLQMQLWFASGHFVVKTLFDRSGLTAAAVHYCPGECCVCV